MMVARGACVFVALAAFAGCTLFSDFGGYSEEPDGAADSSAAMDVTTSDDGASGFPDAPSVDAGPDASPYKRAVLADGPIAYWPFDDAAGASFAREVVGARNAEAVGAITFGVAGVDGTAVERVVNGGNLDVGDHLDLAGQQAYSIEFWAFMKGTAEFENVFHKRDGNRKGWIVYFRGGAESVQIEHTYAAGQRTTFAKMPLPKAKFHHVVFVFDPADPTEKRQRVYVDGMRTDGFSDDGPADDVTTSLRLLESMVGILDEVAIYDRALTVERIAAHFALGPK